MDKYSVTIEVKCYFDIDVEAKNVEQAKKIAMEAYRCSDIEELYRIDAKIIMVEPIKPVRKPVNKRG